MLNTKTLRRRRHDFLPLIVSEIFINLSNQVLKKREKNEKKTVKGGTSCVFDEKRHFNPKSISKAVTHSGTIGDAFMVASGLNVTGEGESISVISPDSSITPGGQGDYLLPQSLSRSHLDEVDEKSSGLDSQSIGAKTLTGKTIIK